MPGLYGNVGNTTVSGGNTTGLYSTTSPVTVSNNINVNDINASGNLFVAGTGTFGGNVTAPNFIGNLTGNVSGNISGNVVAPGSNTQVIYNDSGSLGADPDFTWNESTNTLTVNGAVVATGNISGSYILGNGSQLTGLPATYGNSNVQNYLANGFGSNTITTTGNVTAGYFIGNGSQLTGIVSSYGNANVAAYLPTYTGNRAGGNLAIGNNATINNNLTVGGTIFGTFSGNISGNLVVPGSNTQVIFNNAGNAGASADFTFNDATNTMTVNGTANVGVLNATGNITGDYVFGNAAFMTGIPASYGNANVAAYLPTYTGNIAAGNLTAATTIATGNLQVDGNIFLTKTPEARILASEDLRISASAGQDLYLSNPSITMANIWLDAENIRLARTFGGSDTNVIVTGQITATGNITGANVIGNGQYLTNLPGANVTGTVANATYALNANAATFAGTVTTNAQPNITSVGNLTSLTVSGDALIGGNLQVNGNVTYIASNVVTINDKFINVANNAATSSAANGGGIGVGPVGSEYATWSFSNANTAWQSNIKIEAPALTTTGNVTAAYFFGDGSGLTNINAGNIIGSYGNANVANFLGTGFGSNTITTTGNITAGYFIGNGSQLTGITGTYSNANVAAYLPTYTGNIGAGNLIFTNNAGVAYVNNITGLAGQPVVITADGTEDIHLDADSIRIGDNNTNATIVTHGTGDLILTTHEGSATEGNIRIYDGASGNIDVTTNGTGKINLNGGVFTNDGVTATGNIQGSYIIGNGSALTSITGANVTGTVANATYATSAGSAGSATTAVTVTGNAQANITSVGTLTSLAVSGNVTTGNILTDGYYYANGTPISFGGTYGNANVSNFLANGFGSNTITTTGNITAGNLTTTGNISTANLKSVNIGTVSLTNTNITPGALNVGGALTVSGDLSANGFAVTAGTISIEDGNALILLDSDNTNYVAIRSPSVVASNLTFTLPNSYGSNTQVLTTDGAGNLSWSTGGSGGNAFSTIDANGTSLVADSSSDTLTFAAGSGITITGNATTDTITIAATGGGTYGNANVSNFLANGFGSNTITTTGNITAGNLIGTSLITTTGNANANIFNATTSVIVAGSAGNISGANYVIANYFSGNGSQLTGITTSLSGNLAGNIAANGFFINGLTAITITGNANVGNLGTTAVVATGAITGSTTLAITGNANVGNLGTAGLITATGNVTGGNVIATGTVKSGAVTITGTDGTNGQVLTTYGNGVTYFSTVSGGGGTPGGSDTQIQFNDGGSFAGNAAMTFNKTNGNIEQGNLRIVTNNAGQNPILINTQSFQSTTRPNPGRIGVGGGYANDWTTTYDVNNRWRNARLAVVDRVLGSSAGNTTFASAVNYFETASELYAVNDSGSRITDSTSFGAGRFGLQLWGPNAYGNTANNIHLLASYSALGAAVNIGNTTVGNANVVSAVGSLNTIQVNAGSNANLAISTVASSLNLGTMGTWIGQGFNVTSGSTLTAPGNVYLIHNPGSGSNFLSPANYSIQDSYRAATNYYFLRNDDAVAQVRLGSLRAYHQFRNGLTAASGNITANAAGATGTVFYHNPAANANLLVTGAVVTASDSVNTDQQVTTLTIIIDQGATGYDITLPTTSGTNVFRYKAGANTVANTANSTSIIEYKVYQDAGGNTVYNGQVDTYT